MKKTKRNSVLIVLIVLLLALAVGYAAFQQVLTIAGTATANAEWDIKFVDPTTITEDHGTAIKTADDTISVAATLGYPGDGCEITANITNAGTIKAKLTSLQILDGDGKTYADDDIIITVPDIAGETLDVGENCEVTVAIQWDEDSEVATKAVNFEIVFTYDQDTTAATVSTDHNHN